jgi:hypothetical protein
LLVFVGDFQGRLVVEPGVEPLPTVEHFDVFRNSLPSAFSSGEHGAVHEFVLQRGEERLREGIVERLTG